MSKGKWGIVAAIALIVIGVGVGAGVALSKKSTSSKSTTTSSSDSNSTSSSSSLQYISGTAGVVKSNPSDPSQFEKDSALHQVFYGLGYTPYLSQEPECGATLANVTEDIQLMSQMTTRLRMYGSACNQSQLVLQAIQDTKVNMTVYLGAYVGTNTTVNAEQQQYVIDALNIYGADLVDGVIIGNEYVLDSTDTEEAITYLVSEMKSFRTTVNALGLSKTIPVGTGDAGSELTLALAEGGDFFMANVHFGGVPIDQAAGWTWEYFTDTDVAICNEATNSPLCAAGELGWPSNSMTAENMTDGAAVAGVSELQTFLDTYVCQANTNGTVYYYFEPFDESWKEVYGGPYWGLFDQNKVLKNITLPSC
ncbi:glycoside hydrolase [Meredithblackwellia eburnea MCA 4105]